jgi:hypothetical protein
MICLITDYQRHNPGGKWFQDYNVLQYSRGVTFDSLSVVEEWEAPSGHIWTAPTVIQRGGRPLVVAGINRDGNLPDQRLWMFRIGDPHKSLGHPPEPMAALGFRGYHAWRDAQMTRISDGRYWLTVTTGGFRWGGSPNVILYESDNPLERWHCLGPIVDPALAALYAELERPQLHFIDGRWVLWWSCWPNRHWASTGPEVRQHIAVSSGDEPIIWQPAAALAGVYGTLMYRGQWLAGWNWTDIDKNQGDVVIWRDTYVMPALSKVIAEVMPCRKRAGSSSTAETGA